MIVKSDRGEITEKCNVTRFSRRISELYVLRYPDMQNGPFYKLRKLAIGRLQHTQ